MRKLLLALIVLVSMTSISTVMGQTPKVPPNCTLAPDAKAGHDGYANRVVHDKTGIELILIGPGKFMMGEGNNFKTIREITIKRPFYIGKTEVTNAQYRKFVEGPVYDGTKDTDPAYDLYLRHWRDKSIISKEDDYPIVWVSWKNAKAFCKWAGLELPSETRWEHACRAGTTTAYSFGDDREDLDDYAWYGTNKPGTFPVAQKKPNPWGLYDIHGNVWEWSEDDFVYETETAPTDGSARVEAAMTKTLRGGAWSVRPIYCLTAIRFNSAPKNASNDVGFRVVLSVP